MVHVSFYRNCEFPLFLSISMSTCTRAHTCVRYVEILDFFWCTRFGAEDDSTSDAVLFLLGRDWIGGFFFFSVEIK